MQYEFPCFEITLSVWHSGMIVASQYNFSQSSSYMVFRRPLACLRIFSVHFLMQQDDRVWKRVLMFCYLFDLTRSNPTMYFEVSSIHLFFQFFRKIVQIIAVWESVSAYLNGDLFWQGLATQVPMEIGRHWGQLICPSVLLALISK